MNFNNDLISKIFIITSRCTFSKEMVWIESSYFLGRSATSVCIGDIKKEIKMGWMQVKLFQYVRVWRVLFRSLEELSLRPEHGRSNRGKER